MINLELTWPPSVNEYWKPGIRANNGRVTVYMTPRGKQFRRDSIYLIRSQIFGFKPMAGELSLKIQLTPPRQIGDIDNVVKPILDALQHAGVIENDRQIKHLEVWMLAAQAPGFVRLSIENIVNPVTVTQRDPICAEAS